MSSTLPPGFVIRPLRPDDDLVQITDLIHSAYAPHAQGGLRYWGTHQTVDDTAKRFAMGWGVVVTDPAGSCIATCTVRRSQPESPVPLYRDPAVVSLSQFCVSPAHKGMGLGRLVHEQALQVARDAGATTMALDTAAPALALITMYESWGYRKVGACDWRPHTNYPSVLMARAVDMHPPHSPQ